jgi:hypothetical protein
LAFALVGLSLVSLAALTVSRAEIGALVDASPQSRYSVLIVMPLLPLIALELHLAWQWFRVRLTRTRLGEARTTQVMAIAGAACIAVFSMAVITSTEREGDRVRTSRLIRRTMSAIVSTPSTRETRSDIALMPFFFDLDVGGVWSLVDWGWFEPEEVTDPKNLLAIQARFLVYSGLHEPSDDPVTLHLGADVESDRGEGSCVSLSPLSDSNRVALIRGTGPSFMVITDGAENVELRALRDGVRSNWHRLLDDPTTSDVRILSDPEVDLVMRLLGPATFCETSVIDTAG